MTSLFCFSPLQTVGRPAIEGVVPIPAQDASADLRQGLALIVAHSSDSKLQDAPFLETQVYGEARHPPGIDDPVEGEIRVPRLAVAADLP